MRGHAVGAAQYCEKHNEFKNNSKLITGFQDQLPLEEELKSQVPYIFNEGRITPRQIMVFNLKGLVELCISCRKRH